MSTKRKAAPNSKKNTIVKYFAQNHEKVPEYRQNVLDSLKERAQETSRNEPIPQQKTIEKTPEVNEYKKKNALYEKQIIELKLQIEKLLIENEQYKKFIEQHQNLSEHLYTEFGFDEISKIKLLSLNGDAKHDRRYIKHSLEALYSEETSKLQNRSLKGYAADTKSISPDKLHKVKRLFWNRLANCTTDPKQRNSRFELADTHISKSLIALKKKLTEKEQADNLPHRCEKEPKQKIDQ